MSNCNHNMEFGSFDKAVKCVNKVLKAVEDVCKQIWENNCKRCKLRKLDPSFKVIMCKYPERINCTNKNNCTFESCPLIHRRCYV